MIIIHILIFAFLYRLAIKLHGNNFLNTVALSILVASLSFLIPAIFYSYDSVYAHPSVENGFINLNLLFYIEAYFLLFIVFTINIVSIPSFNFNIYKSYIFPIFYIIISIISIKEGLFFLDVTQNNSGNTYLALISFLRGSLFLLGLYTLVNYKSVYLIPYLTYHAIYTGLSGSKGGILFVLLFVVIYYFQDKKIFSLRNLKYYLLMFISLPIIFYIVTAYRTFSGIQGDGSGVLVDYEGFMLYILDTYNINDIYYYLVKRADQIGLFQMTYNNFDGTDFLMGKSFELIPNHLLPSFIFPEKMIVQDLYGPAFTEKIIGEELGHTVIGLAPPIEAYINFSILGFVIGALHGIIYNVFYQLMQNKRDSNFFIAFFSANFFIVSDGFLSVYIASYIKNVIYLILFILFANLFVGGIRWLIRQ